MFKGSHAVTVDAKGRIAIPASYRQSLLDDCAGRLVLTRHWDGCLLIYPAPEFQAFETQLLARGSLNPKERDIQRFFIGNARDVDMDRQGRLLLPEPLGPSNPTKSPGMMLTVTSDRATLAASAIMSLAFSALRRVVHFVIGANRAW